MPCRGLALTGTVLILPDCLKRPASYGSQATRGLAVLRVGQPMRPVVAGNRRNANAEAA